MATWTLSAIEVEEAGGSLVLVTGVAAVSGTYTTGGDTFSFAKWPIPSSKPPVGPVTVLGKAGFIYAFEKGTTIANGKVQIFCNTAGGSNTALGEHTAASVVAGVTGDTIRFSALFKRE